MYNLKKEIKSVIELLKHTKPYKTKDMANMQKLRESSASRLTVKDVAANTEMMNEQEEIYLIYDNLKNEVQTLTEFILEAPR